MSWGDAFKSAWKKATKAARQKAAALAVDAKKTCIIYLKNKALETAENWGEKKKQEAIEWANKKTAEVAEWSKQKTTQSVDWLEDKAIEVAPSWAKDGIQEAATWVKDNSHEIIDDTKEKAQNFVNKKIEDAYETVKKEFSNAILGRKSGEKIDWGDAFKAAWNNATEDARQKAAALAVDAKNAITDHIKNKALKKVEDWAENKKKDAIEWANKKTAEVAEWSTPKTTQSLNWLEEKAIEVAPPSWAKDGIQEAAIWAKDKSHNIIDEVKEKSQKFFTKKIEEAYKAVKKIFGNMVAGATKIICQTANFLLGPSKKPNVVDKLFSPEKLNSIIDQKIQGENSESLQNAMQTLWDNRDNSSVQDNAVQKALQVVAKERGKSLDKIQGDWKSYQNLLKEQLRTGKANDQDDVPGINFMHSDFMASTSQLRFGKIVGDAFGIDPVFGALLNPTGGLVGPGNIGYDGNDSAIGYHGAVHDAAGYLINYHNKGPGYDYLGTDNRDTTSPLSGQRNGIRYWRDQLRTESTPDEQIKDLAGETVMRGVVGIADMYEYAQEAASKTWDNIVDFFD